MIGNLCFQARRALPVATISVHAFGDGFLDVGYVDGELDLQSVS